MKITIKQWESRGNPFISRGLAEIETHRMSQLTKFCRMKWTLDGAKKGVRECCFSEGNVFKDSHQQTES